MRLVLANPRLFWLKSLMVFVLAFALVPLVALKSDVPKMAYAGSLVVLHIAIIAVYFYRVKFRELDPDRRSLVARLIGLALTTYILSASSSFDADSSVADLAWQMLAVSVIHMVMLLLLMVRHERRLPSLSATDRLAS